MSSNPTNFLGVSKAQGRSHPFLNGRLAQSFRLSVGPCLLRAEHPWQRKRISHGENNAS